MSLFGQLLEVLRPSGGALMVICQGYFDESGDLESGDRIFCISGYFIESERAKEMDREWRAVLEKFQLGFFHMVDCAHGVDGFEHLNLSERIAVETELIGLIKKYTLAGFSALVKHEQFEASDRFPDEYSACAEACVVGLGAFLKSHRVEGGVAYFFESGHRNRRKGYTHLAHILNE